MVTKLMAIMAKSGEVIIRSLLVFAAALEEFRRKSRAIGAVP
jgi:hypothetical protein